MEEAHSLLHQITGILGIKQCTSTQVLGICLEFWVGGAVAFGALKLKTLYGIKSQLEAIQNKKSSRSKKSRKKKKGKK